MVSCVDPRVNDLPRVNSPLVLGNTRCSLRNSSAAFTRQRVRFDSYPLEYWNERVPGKMEFVFFRGAGHAFSSGDLWINFTSVKRNVTQSALIVPNGPAYKLFSIFSLRFYSSVNIYRRKIRASSLFLSLSLLFLFWYIHDAWKMFARDEGFCEKLEFSYGFYAFFLQIPTEGE